MLIITRGLPYPPEKNGRYTVVYPIIKYLHKEFDIDLLYSTVGESRYSPEIVQHFEEMCVNLYTFKTWKHPYARYFTAIFHWMPLVFVFYSNLRFYFNIKKIFTANKNKYDVVIISDSQMVRFIKRIGLDDNTFKVFIPFDYMYLQFKRIAESTSSVVSKFYHNLSAWKLLRYEPLVYENFDKIIYVSGKDKSYFAQKHPELSKKIQVIPMGINKDRFWNPSGDTIIENSILFFGNMNYEPNRLAVYWFYENVFELLKESINSIKWIIVGRDAGKFIKINDPSIIVKSSVPSLEPYLKEASVVVSPLNVGTGVKNKVLEAMAYSNVVVGSPLSFDGIDITPDKHAIVAKKPEDYVQNIKILFENEKLRQEIERNAHEFVKENFSMEKVIGKWRDLIYSAQSS